MKSFLRNTKTLILYLFTVSLLCTNVACSNDNDHTDPDYEVGDESSFKGESENILIEIQEDYYIPGDHSLVLTCKTETEFWSCGYQLITDQSFKKNSLTISFIGVSKPDPEGSYLAVTSPAFAIVDLTDLENGKYEIELNNGDLKNKGTLIITKEKVELQVKNQKGIKIINPTFKRATTSN